MGAIELRAASEPEREWAAQLMASSEPWLTLWRGIAFWGVMRVDSRKCFAMHLRKSEPVSPVKFALGRFFGLKPFGMSSYLIFGGGGYPILDREGGIPRPLSRSAVLA